MENKEFFLNRMEDMVAKAAKTGFGASKFLTPAEAASVASHFARRQDILLRFDGGYESAERTRAIFLNPHWGSYEQKDLLAALKISHRPQDTLGHRDILGALMGLGIERDTVGDIVTGLGRADSESSDGGNAALICLPEMSGYIRGHLEKAGRVGINITEMPLEAFPAKEEELLVKTDTVASLRLDAILCAAFGLPRSKSTEWIAAGLCSLNHEVCLQPAKEVGEKAILSLRGFGRAKLLEVAGTSKKGRIFIKIGLYKR